MTIYLVIAQPSIGGSASRYTDSYWVEQSSAQRRASQLLAEFKGRNFNSEWKAWVIEATLEDAKQVPSE